MYTLVLYDITGTTPEATITDAVIRKYSMRINAAGRMEYTIPVGSVNASSERLQKRKRVRLFRTKQDGSGESEAVWYGFIEAHKRTSQAEYTVFCSGMLQLFAHRYTTKDQTFTDEGSVDAFSLLTAANSENDTGIAQGDGGVTTTKSTRAIGYKDILGVWIDLAKAHGAEFRIDFEGNFHFVQSFGEDKTDTILRYRTDGEPGTNVNALSEGEDAVPLRNKIIGTNTDGTLTTVKENASSQALYGVISEVKVFNEAQDESTLEAMTQSYLDQVSVPVSDFGASPTLAARTINVVTGGLDIEGFQYGDLTVGDLVTCDIISGSSVLQAEKRIVEILMTLDENLNEIVQYTLGDEGVFVSVNSIEGSSYDEIQRRILALEQTA